MKVTSLVSTLVLFALAITPTGCERHTSSPADAVVFAGAGVALVPGKDWQELKSDPQCEDNLVCPPLLLQGEGDLDQLILQVYSSPTDLTPPEARAALLREQIELRPELIMDSFTQEKFTTDSGLTGVHLSYVIAAEVQGKKLKYGSHNYIIQNARGAAVTLSISGSVSRDIKPVQQMISKTLRLE